METNLVVEGFKFMGLGMGIVFVFLSVMIVAMNIMSTVIHKFFPEPQPKAEHKSSAQTAVKQDKNTKVVAAISAAIMHHRQG